MVSRNVKGFTLLEVLVASFILFMVVATATSVYSGAIKSKLSAEKALKLHGFTPILIEQAGERVRGGEASGESQFMGVSYSWSSAVVETKSIVDKSNSSGDGESTPSVSSTSNKSATLSKVNLSVREGNRSNHIEFLVTSWQ